MSDWFHFWYVGDLNKTDATVPSMHHPAPTLVTLDPSLPSNLASELTELADQNPGISVLTVRKRKSWAVYAVHTDIPKSLTRPFRKVGQIVDSVRNWLKQALPSSAGLATATSAPHADEAPDFATPQIQTDESSVATTHVVEFLMLLNFSTVNGISSRYWKLRNPAEPYAQFPVWIEDIRVVKIKLTEDKVRRGRSVTSSVNPIDVRWEISSEERERYITTLHLVMKDGENDDPHASQRARAQFEVAPIKGSQRESE